MDNFGLDQKINGVSAPQYLANQLEKMELDGVNLEKEKIKISYMKQMNNYLRLSLDAAKFLQKKAELEYSCLLREKKLEAK